MPVPTDDAPNDAREDEGRVSMAPLDPEEALRALLAVKPEESGEPIGDDDLTTESD